jgi:plastocyanin
MKTWLTALGVSLALGVVSAGCGGDDDGGEGSGAALEPAEEPADEAGGGVRAGTVRVVMKNIAFQPRSITVGKGRTVTWINDDRIEHDVAKRSGAGGDFNSGEPGGLAPGDIYENTFRTPGKIAYYCRVHPGMRGTITVRRRAGS